MVRSAALAALALTSCSDQYDADRCPHINLKLESAIRANGAIDYVTQAKNVEACLAKWGFALARANDNMEHVAGAVLGACADAINIQAEAWAQRRMALEKLPAMPEPDYKGDTDRARDQALFYVAAERAGNCSRK